MSLNIDDKSVIGTLERWFKSRCDGSWEHDFGITIETTDNPGWLLTFTDLRLAKEMRAGIIGKLLREYNAQIEADGAKTTVYAPSLQEALIAATLLLNQAEPTEKESE